MQVKQALLFMSRYKAQVTMPQVGAMSYCESPDFKNNLKHQLQMEPQVLKSWVLYFFLVVGGSGRGSVTERT